VIFFPIFLYSLLLTFNYTETLELREELFVLNRQRNYMHDVARKTTFTDNLVSMRTFVTNKKEKIAKYGDSYVPIVTGQKSID
jgi:hypothetical protein